MALKKAVTCAVIWSGVPFVLPAASAALSLFAFHSPPVVPLPALAAAWIVVTLLTVGIGVLGSRGIADESPLEVLRREA